MGRRSRERRARRTGGAAAGPTAVGEPGARRRGLGGVRPRLLWLVPVGVALVTAAAFANAAPPAAVHDDKFFVPNVFRLDPASVLRLFSEDPWGAAGAPAGRYRPLLLLTFAIDGALFGDNLRGYHLTNIAVHVVTTVALYFVLGALLRRFTPRPAGSTGRPWLAAAVAAGVFGVHPIHTEVVDSIFNGSDMYVALGTLAAFAAVIRWEGSHPLRAWLLVGCSYLAALLFRENAAVLPVLVVALIWLLHPEEDLRRRFRRLVPSVGLLLPLAVYLWLRRVALAHVVPPTAPALAENLTAEGTVGERLALFATTMREYLRMVVWPHPLRASYENFAPSGVTFAVLLQALLIGGALGAWRRSPWLAFGVGFFYVALLPSTRLLTAATHASGLLAQPASGLILVAERTLYMPSVGLAFPLAFGIAALGRRWGPLGILACGGCLVGVLTPLTLARNTDWRSDVSLWEAEVRADPSNGDAWRLLTGAYVNSGRNEQTAEICDRELGGHPRLAQLANNCAVAYQRLGRAMDAEAAYHHAIDLGLASVGHANLGRLFEHLGRTADAEQEYARAAETEEEPARQHFRRGQWLMKFHPDRLDAAESEFQRAIEILPDWSQPRSALAEVRAQRARGR
jgi:tetratricopeptide (TPR) repeat protein